MSAATWQRPSNADWHQDIWGKLADIDTRGDSGGDDDFYAPVSPAEKAAAEKWWAAAIKAAPSNTLQLADVLDAPDLPDPLFSNGPIAGDLGLLIAESGRGKSYLALQLAASVATGCDLLPAFAPAADEQMRVLYLSYEDNESVIRKRLDAIGRGFECARSIGDALETLHLAFVTTAAPLLGMVNRAVKPTPQWDKLDRMLSHVAFDLVIIDPLSGAAVLDDESSNSQLARVAALLAGMAEKHDCAIVVVHHASKARAEEPSQHMARGASALVCRTRWAATLTASSIKSPDGAPMMDLSIVKMNRDALPPPVLLRRGEGGILEQLSRQEIKLKATTELAEILAHAIGENEDDLSSWDIVKNARGKYFREQLKSVLGDAQCTRDRLLEALESAINRGLLKMEKTKIGGVSRAIPRLAVQ